MTEKSELEITQRQTSLLNYLLDRAERSSGRRLVSVKVTPDRFAEYFRDEDPGAVLSWTEEIRSLEALGWISLDHGKGAEAHRIVRIRLQAEKTDEIVSRLKRMTLEMLRRGAMESLSYYLEETRVPGATYQQWWLSFLTDETKRVTDMRVQADRRIEALEELKLLYSALKKIVGLKRPMSWRLFSVSFFSDTKKLDSIKREIARVLAAYGLSNEATEAGDALDFQSMDEAAIFSHFGIESKEEVFLIKGPLRVYFEEDEGVKIDASDWSPFLAIPQAMVNERDARLVTAAITAVLTIENEESFHSWCRQNQRPDWLAVYLAGFPSKGKVRFLENLARSGLPFYHWGDLDCGGLEIFLFLERKLGVGITPFGMEPSWLENLSQCAKQLTKPELSRLNRLQRKMGEQHPLNPLVDAMTRLRCKLEQEAIVPHE